MLTAVRQAFAEAAQSFSALLAEPAAVDRWTQPSAVERYTVGGLTAHVSAAIAWIVPLCDAAAPPGPPSLNLGDYYLDLRIAPDTDSAPTHDLLVAIAQNAAGRGPERVIASFASAVERATQRLGETDLARLVDLRPALAHTMRLDEFAATRVVELVVHGDDLAASLSLPTPESGAAAAALTIDVLMATARRRYNDTEVIRALARRGRGTTEVFPVL